MVPGGRSGCGRWRDRFELTPLDVELLLIALIPDLDSRFERLYGYLNDDVTRRRATVGLALTLADRRSTSSAARARLSAGPRSSTARWCWSRRPTGRS